MSVCISKHGEYGSHTPDDGYTCTMCGVLDETALIAELRRLRDLADKTLADQIGRDAATRADERAKVRAELLALTEEEDHGGFRTRHPCCYSAHEIADRIAPELK